MKKYLLMEYYFLAMSDIRNGSSIQDLEDALKIFEDRQEFEACAGIFKAIKEVKYTTLKNLKDGH